MIPIFGFDPAQLAVSCNTRRITSAVNFTQVDSDPIPLGRVWIVLGWWAYQVGSSINRRVRLAVVAPSLESISLLEQLDVGDAGSATQHAVMNRVIVVPGTTGQSYKLRASREAADVGSTIEMQFWYLDLALPSLRSISGIKQETPPRVDEVWPLPSLFSL